MRIPSAWSIDAQTWSSSVSFKPRSNKTDSSYNSFETLSSKRSKVVVMAEEPSGGPMTFSKYN